MINVYFSPKNQEYYSQEQIACDFCNKEGNVIFLITFTNKNQHKRHHYCNNCLREIPDNPYIIKTTRIILLINDLPKDAQPFIENGTEIGYGKMGLTVFNTADKQIDNEKIINKTVHAGRESLAGSIIGQPDMKLLEEKEKNLSLEEFKKELLEISEAEIDCDDQPLLLEDV